MKNIHSSFSVEQNKIDIIFFFNIIDIDFWWLLTEKAHKINRVGSCISSHINSCWSIYKYLFYSCIGNWVCSRWAFLGGIIPSNRVMHSVYSSICRHDRQQIWQNNKGKKGLKKPTDIEKRSIRCYVSKIHVFILVLWCLFVGETL